MRRQTLLNEARDLLTLFVSRVRGSTVLGHTDLNKISERFLLELFRKVFGVPRLRDLNEEKPNYPGLDLADDESGMAFQVTASTDLEKVKDTLRTVLNAGLHLKFPAIRIYVLTEKPSSRAQISIDKVTRGELKFDLRNHVLDFRDILRVCGSLEIDQLEEVVAILKRNIEHPPERWTHKFEQQIALG